jgi:hypothetical protein
MPSKDKGKAKKGADYVPLGTGGADRAERAIIKRKERNRDAMAEAFKYASGQRRTKPK